MAESRLVLILIATSLLKSIRVHLVPGSKMHAMIKHSDLLTG